jgi:hypothetical protein
MKPLRTVEGCREMDYFGYDFFLPFETGSLYNAEL